MTLAREEVAKRLASATNKSSKKKSSDATSSTSQEKERDFKVGDFCRSTYEDGIDYEARILAKGASTNEFLIKYIGYNNEELTNATKLLPSWGKKHRKQQKLAAELEKANKPVKSQGSAAETHLQAPTKIDASVMFPPPPPMPPFLEGENAQDAEHLSAMLMSWYMSGYYTGLYQGQKIVARRQQN